jgi:hypothetical protein
MDKKTCSAEEMKNCKMDKNTCSLNKTTCTEEERKNCTVDKKVGCLVGKDENKS